MVTTKQCIIKNQPISACANIGRNISTISKNIDCRYAISAADIMPIQYIGIPLQYIQLVVAIYSIYNCLSFIYIHSYTCILLLARIVASQNSPIFSCVAN